MHIIKKICTRYSQCQWKHWMHMGSANHVNLDEHLDKEQYLKLLETASQTGCNYFTFNIPNSECKDCGKIVKRRIFKCESCGSENIDHITRIIGYLKRVSAFSEPRQHEEGRRYYAKQ